MIDFETLGSGSDTMVLSVGCVAFNKTGIVSSKLFEFDLLSQQIAGRSFTASTLQWWMGQKDEAKVVWKQNENKIYVGEFFALFETFCEEALSKVGEKWDEVKPWGNGANFDISILEDMYRRHHAKRDQGIPWKFWNVFCFRTFNHLTGCKKLLARPHGTYHTALADAEYQTNCVLAYWKAQELKRAKK